MRNVLAIAEKELRSYFASPMAYVIIGFFLLWEFLCTAFKVSDLVVPRPSQILVTLWKYKAALWPHTLQTLYTTLAGFAFGIVIGIALGTLVGSSRLAYDVAYPLLVGFASSARSQIDVNIAVGFGLLLVL